MFNAGMMGCVLLQTTSLLRSSSKQQDVVTSSSSSSSACHRSRGAAGQYSQGSWCLASRAQQMLWRVLQQVQLVAQPLASMPSEFLMRVASSSH
jgi:hypothetical protein